MAAAVIGVVCVMGTSLAHASAISLSSGVATLTIADITCVSSSCDPEDLGLFLETSIAWTDDPLVTEPGEGSTTFSASPTVVPPADSRLPMGAGDSVTLSASANASAGPGFADFSSGSLLEISLPDLGDDYEVLFQLTYNLIADARVDDPLLEQASAGSRVEVYDSFPSGEQVEEDFRASADTNYDRFSDTIDNTFDFSLLSDYEDASMYVRLSSYAHARSSLEPSPPQSVPEPSTLALMGIGLAGVGFARRRKA